MKKLNFLPLSLLLAMFLVSCGGSQPGNDTANAGGAPVNAGAAIYSRACASCHLANGDGMPGVYPPLAKSDFLADKGKTIRQLISGYTGEQTVNGVKYNNSMPAQQLSDDEIATVLTYVNTNFGNSDGPVTAADVKAAREQK